MTNHPWRHLLRFSPLTATLAWLVMFSGDPALACGGGGSGSYRKPPRPDHHQTVPVQTQSQAAPASQQMNTSLSTVSESAPARP